MSPAAIEISGRNISREEYENIFRTYYNSLCNYANTWLKDMDSAEEVVQEVFVRLWDRKNQVSIDTSVKSYLYKAVYHASLNEIKHQKVKENYINMNTKEERTVNPSSGENIKQLENKIEKAMLSLPEQCRLVFRLSRFEELKYREIAAVLNISVKTVENQMGKALRIMRENLADYLVVLLMIIGLLNNSISC